MKSHKQPTLLLGIFFVLLISSCAPTPVAVKQNKHETPDSLSSPLRPATIIPVTKTPDFAPTLFFTSTPTNTPTLIATISQDGAKYKLTELLANNGYCQLPCLWGLTPGISSYDDAISNLYPMIGISDFDYLDSRKQSGSIGFLLSQGDLEIHTDVSFLVDSSNRAISKIGFYLKVLQRIPEGFLEVFDSPYPRKNYYLLSKLLNDYGQPESAWISTQSSLSSRDILGGTFELLLLYPDQGIFIHYTTLMTIVGSNVRGCFLNPQAKIELYPPGQRDFFLQNLETDFWPQYAPNRFRPLENVTNLSFEEFYDIFRHSTNNCIDTPASLWPTPD